MCFREMSVIKDGHCLFETLVKLTLSLKNKDRFFVYASLRAKRFLFELIYVQIMRLFQMRLVFVKRPGIMAKLNAVIESAP